MDMRDNKNHPQNSPKQQNNQKTDADDLTKIIKQLGKKEEKFEILARDLENLPIPRRSIKMRRIDGILPKHLDRAIIAAEKYSDRDLLCRRLSSQCYATSKAFMKKADYDNAFKWMKLTDSFMQRSLEQKKMQMDEKFDAELAELRKAIEEGRQQQIEMHHERQRQATLSTDAKTTEQTENKNEKETQVRNKIQS